MNHSMVAPKTFVIKLNIHCKGGERKLKGLLLNIPGVDSIAIDAKQGTVTVSGTVDPQTVITTLGKVGKVAELLWEESPLTSNNRNLQIVPRSEVDDQVDDQHMVAHELQQLNGIEGLKHVELTYKVVKLTFKDDSSCGNERHAEVIVRDDVYRRQMSPSGRPGGGSGGGGGGLGTPCCHGMNNIHDHHPCCQIDTSYCVEHSNAGAMHDHEVNECYWPPPVCQCSPPPGPPPPWTRDSPSAPPLAPNYDPPPPPPPPPPPMDYTYSSIFMDENTNSCKLM